MFALLYSIFIYPIELILEFIFSVIYDIRNSAFLAIIGVSLVVNLLLLPLYDRADRISREERDRQQAMSGWVKHIRKSFTGDERFMMLQTYYRKQGYHYIYSLRSSVSLLLQIPFFIAAYHFIANLKLLDGYGFHCIQDLGQPDGLIIIGNATIGEIQINALPILMTLINIISIMVYTKGGSIKEKLQLLAMACIFLILLYDSPSGLVVYWTMNNIFSLGKSIIYSRREPDKADRLKSEISPDKDKKLFVYGIFVLTLLMGLVIPLSVIVSSPEEFVTLTAYRDPIHYTFSTLLIAMGFFLIWLSIFYYLMDAGARQLCRAAIWIISVMAMVNFFLFGKVPLTISSELVYRGELSFGKKEILINIVVLAVVFGITLFIWKHKHSWIEHIYQVLIFSLVALSTFNLISTEKQLSQMSYLKHNTPYEGFCLSEKGKNVVVIMLDAAIGLYYPYILDEKPELRDVYEGFVYFPNTLSHGEHTMMGAPGLYGGYEYTPEAMDNRPNERLVDKHDEALLVLPRLFSEEGYKTTVYDPPLAGYNDVSDLTIYDPYPDIQAYTLKNRFVSPESVKYTEDYRKRQFFMYSVFKSVPVFVQPFIYRGGNYHYPDTFSTVALENVNSEFTDSYAILDNLKGITSVTKEETNTFMIMDNDTTHDQRELQLPDYTATDNPDNTGLEDGKRTDSEGNVIELKYPEYYHVNMAALIKIGEWLNYLKEQDVYDNTRIVIVSDHGAGIGDSDEIILDDGTDTEGFRPLLLYKDFYSKNSRIDASFMTNADTPFLATTGVIEDPINLFTGCSITESPKQGQDQYVMAANIQGEPGKTFAAPDQNWYAVRDDVRIIDNWKRVKPR
jgi:YidC/Oxa1 family membrane protein insertase